MKIAFMLNGSPVSVEAPLILTCSTCCGTIWG